MKGTSGLRVNVNWGGWEGGRLSARSTMSSCSTKEPFYSYGRSKLLIPVYLSTSTPSPPHSFSQGCTKSPLSRVIGPSPHGDCADNGKRTHVVSFSPSGVMCSGKRRRHFCRNRIIDYCNMVDERLPRSTLSCRTQRMRSTCRG